MAGSPQLTPPNRTRLESWKEIAAYLRRDRRTVQRWEASEGLPVHRHVHQSNATVFAFAEELDAWLSRRLDFPKPAPHGEPEQPDFSAPVLPAGQSRPRAYRRAWIAIGFSVVLVAAIAKLGPNHSALRFQEHDWILLDAFENRTKEAALDSALRNVLALELSSSTFVSIAPQERVEDTLRLMKKSPNTKIDEALAREVSLRDGGIRALVTGVTEKRGSTYVFTVRVIDPGRNIPVALHTENANAQDQIYAAVRKLSNWVRESLGEAMDQVQQSNQKLEKVTTPSLLALELFTQGDSAARHARWPQVVELTGKAISEDPTFASAHLWRAFALKNLHQPEWTAEADRALALAGTVSERERYFIIGGNHLLHDRPDEAAPVLETLVRLYPDHYFGVTNLILIYRQTIRYREAREAATRLANLRPNNVDVNITAAGLLLPFDEAAARHYGDRALELATQDTSLPFRDREIPLFRFDELWAQEDIRGAHAELERVAKLEKSAKQPDDFQIALLVKRYIVLGEFKLAQEWVENISPKYRPVVTAAVSYYRGDTARTQEILAQDLPRDAGYDTGILYARLTPPGWEQKIGDLGNGPMKAIALNVFRAQSDLLAGRMNESLSRFQTSLDALKESGTPMYLVIGEMFAEALERAGKPQKAIEVLEQVTRLRTTSPGGPVIELLRNQARLARLYRSLGRETEAAAIEARLRKLLTYADPEHPILRELQRQTR